MQEKLCGKLIFVAENHADIAAVVPPLHIKHTSNTG
jgi:hypothetical protein